MKQSSQSSRAAFVLYACLAQTSALQSLMQTGVRRLPRARLAMSLSLGESGRSRSSSNNGGVLATKLGYRDSGDEDSSSEGGRRIDRSMKYFGWWKEERKVRQESVDDYLQFLEHRYHRLHKSDEADEAKLPILKWITQVSADGETFNAQAETENALFVLGVADLASQEFREKRQLLTDSSIVEPPVPSAAESDTSELPAEIPVAQKRTVIKQSIQSAIKCILESRRRLLNYEQLKLRAASSAVFKTMKSWPSKFFQLSGGVQAFTLTLAAILAVANLVVRQSTRA